MIRCLVVVSSGGTVVAPPLERGTQFAAFLEAELKREIDRRDSINTRAIAALTGATGLATLVLALFAVVIGKDATINGAAKILMMVAVLALLAASGFALVAARPRKNYVIGVETLEEIITPKIWGLFEPHARHQTSRLIIEQIKDLRPETLTRGRRLIASAALQVVAVLFLGLSTIVVVFTQQPASEQNVHGQHQNGVGGHDPAPGPVEPKVISSSCKPPLTFLLICH
ncbi:hypothetical protein [Mycolicibacterium sphagni]|uniref:Uncharacterized protein n=1 Tax=Mycolicibacterium sphagni TaxID=1786 RepID=A0ABX2JM18_9MYCO|nr:hypothetical protein [Mycolicibacterium sphagni]NTY58731.1 hypothetical protein [Mycolicibacterium sphagni]